MATLLGAGAPPLPPAFAYSSRVVAHIDLDCFYCQVEQRRLDIPREQPCAVQQWQGLIAVNYAARAAGVTRHMRVAEALHMCPELRTVHVETIGNTAAAHTPGEVISLEVGAVDTAQQHGITSAAGEGSAADRGSAKACLQRYRRASAEVMRLLAENMPGCALERASIDEAYIDISAPAARELARAEASSAELGAGVAALLAAACASSCVLGSDGLCGEFQYDRLVAAGALLVQRLRDAVLARLGFTCSAGVAPNKLLAKIASALHKPAQQTIVLPRSVPQLMESLSLGRVRGLGGKLGAQLEALGVTTAGEVAALPWEVLLARLGSKARWVYCAVRGMDDDEPVVVKELSKSLNSCKSFAATCEESAVCSWLAVLAAELSERMSEDETEHGRRARTLVLQYRGGVGQPASGRGGPPERSVRAGMPGSQSHREGPQADAIAAAALALFRRIQPRPWPLTRLALAATDFVAMPGGSCSSSSAMARFLEGAGAAAASRLAACAGLQDSKVEQPASRDDQQLLCLAERSQHGLAAQQHRLAGPGKFDAAGPDTTQQAAALQRAAVQKQQAFAEPSLTGCSTVPSLPADNTGVTCGEVACTVHPATADTGVPSADADLLTGINVAEQARLLRECEVRAMLQRHQDHRAHPMGSTSGSASAGRSQAPKRLHTAGSRGGGAAKRGRSTGSRGSGKQLSIAALLGSAQHPP